MVGSEGVRLGARSRGGERGRRGRARDAASVLYVLVLR